MEEMISAHVTLKLVVAMESVDGFLEQLRAAIAGRRWPRVRTIASPTMISGKPKYVRPRVDQLEPLLAEIKTLAKEPADVRITFAELSSIGWGQRPDGKTIHLTAGFAPADKVFDDPVEGVRALTHVARGMLAGGHVASAAVERIGDPGVCVPFVPFAKTRRPLVVTTDAEVAEAYDRPEEFWSAGWTIETFGEKKLLTRCQDVITAGDVLRETQDAQWQMARAAKPKRTSYGPPQVAPDERAIYEEGDARIVPVGLNAKTGTAHYSCVLERGEHVRGFEIYYLRSLVDTHRMQDGTPVSKVQVVFQKKWMAESERRPLLDVGVEVFYRDLDSGELVQLTD